MKKVVLCYRHKYLSKLPWFRDRSPWHIHLTKPANAMSSTDASFIENMQANLPRFYELENMGVFDDAD